MRKKNVRSLKILLNFFVEEPVIIQSNKRRRKGEPSDVSKSKKPKPDIVITSNDLECKECGKTFTRKDNMKRHVTRVH